MKRHRVLRTTPLQRVPPSPVTLQIRADNEAHQGLREEVGTRWWGIVGRNTPPPRHSVVSEGVCIQTAGEV